MVLPEEQPHSKRITWRELCFLSFFLLTIMAASNVIVASGRIIHVGNSGTEGEGVMIGLAVGVGEGEAVRDVVGDGEGDGLGEGVGEGVGGGLEDGTEASIVKKTVSETTIG